MCGQNAYRILRRSYHRFGNLNVAYVFAHLQEYGVTSIRRISRDTGLSRGVVRRSLQIIEARGFKIDSFRVRK